MQEPTAFDVDELIEFWTLLDEDRALLAGKRGATALGFAVLSKHYSRHGQFPRRRSEVPDDVIVFAAAQLGVDAADLGFYEWSGGTIEYHRAQVRDHLGYRVATVADQERLTVWLSEAVVHAERRLYTRSVGLTVSVRSCWPSSAGYGSSRRLPDDWCGWFVRPCAQPNRTGRHGSPAD